MRIKALLVYPEMPPTYWSMRYALPFLGKKAALPPLGLLTVAALLPAEWDLRLLDLNVEPISQKDLVGVDLVLISAMLVQKSTFEKLVTLCRESGVPVVAGGPYPTSCFETIEGVNYFVLGEAEVNLPAFLVDFENGVARHCYFEVTHPEITDLPPPRYDLVNRRRYVGAALQFSRGCPHHCEFCDIVELFGHRSRTKTTAQFLAELDLLYESGWRGSVFVVDDNFIGNRHHVRQLLPELAHWQAKRHFPFSLYTEATLDLALDDSLMEGMVQAGFNMVFVGIETPDKGTLEAIDKPQNSRCPDLLASVQVIQRKGIEVSGGFIVGFDEDQEDIFDRQIQFINEAAIPTAMVGLLTALPKTRLHQRLLEEGRITAPSDGGNNTHSLELNFVPRMEISLLQKGYLRLLEDVYSPRRYFARCLKLIRRMKGPDLRQKKIRFAELRAFANSIIRQTFSHYAGAYWAYMLKGIALRPLMAAEIVTLAVKGHHFFTITEGLLAFERFKAWVKELRRDLEMRINETIQGNCRSTVDLKSYRNRLLKKIWKNCRRIHPDLRDKAIKKYEEFRQNTEQLLLKKP